MSLSNASFNGQYFSQSEIQQKVNSGRLPTAYVIRKSTLGCKLCYLAVSTLHAISYLRSNIYSWLISECAPKLIFVVKFPFE